MNQSAAVLICSHAGSRRIPGKAFVKINGKTVISHVIDRCHGIGLPVYVLVPSEHLNFYKELDRSKALVIDGGHADSPLHRMDYFLRYHSEIRWVLRVTHDDIFIDPLEAGKVLAACIENDYGYAFSRGILEGAGLEVIHSDNIRGAAAVRKEPTEFVSYFVHGPNTARPRYASIPCRSSVAREYRLTLDYPEDVTLARMVLRRLGNDAGVDDICKFLDQTSHLLEINRQPMVTFYTCAFDAERWIEKSMLSVLHCGVDNFEYIVMDDGSQDSTLERAAGFINDPRLRLEAVDANQGLAKCSNLALSKARGKYVMRVDADDILLPGHVQRMVAELEDKSDYAAVFARYDEIDEHGRTIHSGRSPLGPRHSGCALFRRKFLNELKYREDIRHWDSYELIGRMQEMGAPFILYEHTAWLYRQRKGSLSEDTPERREDFGKILTGEIGHG